MTRAAAAVAALVVGPPPPPPHLPKIAVIMSSTSPNPVDHDLRVMIGGGRLRTVRSTGGPRGWWLDAAMVAGFVTVVTLLTLAPVRSFDLAIRDLADANRPGWADRSAQLANGLGSGGVLAIAALGLAVILALVRRSLWPIAPVVTAFLLTGIAIAPLKWLFHRAAPHSRLADEVGVRLFSQPDGLSFPSGHAVNTIVWYGVICLLLARWLGPPLRTWIRWLPPIVVGMAGIYLGHHWVTDVIAGICLGILIDRAITRTPWPALPGGQPRRSPS